MKAHISRSPTNGGDMTVNTHTPTIELVGMYLRAMQEISAHLMDALPAEESLWQTLASTESLLIEAQLAGVPLQDVFRNGGVAGFCQSIVDEYNQKRLGQPRDIPAAHDPSLKNGHTVRKPRGGINLHRKRRLTFFLIGIFALILAVLAVWYTGLLKFWFKGTDYYLDELYHFENTVIPVSNDPIRFTLPLKPIGGLDHVLYTDIHNKDLVLTELAYIERLCEIEDDGLKDGQQSYRKNYVWYITIRYPVKVGYTKITYIAPSTTGTTTLTLSSGEIITYDVSAYRSEADGKGYEYISLEVMDIPASTNIADAVLSVTLDPPNTVEWNRIGIGFQ